MGRTIWWEGWPDRNRPLYLELREIDRTNNVARFDFSLDSGSREMWLAREPGYMHDSAVLDKINAAIVGTMHLPDVIEIPLSEDPQTTKIEVWDADLNEGMAYLIQTKGIHPDQFQYIINAELSAGLVRGYLVEESTEVYRLSDDESLATHEFGLTTVGGNLVHVVTKGSDTNGLRTVVDNSRMKIYEV